MIDPRTNAVRPDIADVRLADRVFAPHYAAPLRRVVLKSVELRGARAPDSDIVIRLSAGDAFDLFDLTGGVAWGIAVEAGLVGYCDAAAMGASVS